MGKNKSLKIYYTLILLIVGAGIAVVMLNQVILKREQEKRDLHLTNIHSSAVSQLKASIDQFAAIAAGLRSYTHQSTEIPQSSHFQRFTNSLLEELNFDGKYVISVIDTSHVFIYAFDNSYIDPNHLAGNHIPQVTNPEIIARMDSIMLDRDIHVSRPINLLEGWMGLSFSFSLYRGGIPIGYVTPIFSLQEIMESIYSEGISEEFIFKFSTQNGENFDRFAIHNASIQYSDHQDPEYFENFDIPEDSYRKSMITMYGQTFSISTAFKEDLPTFNLVTLFILIGFILFIFAFMRISGQAIQMETLNESLMNYQGVITQQKKELEEQNTELTQLNKTKDRFFSIIGHDLKSPLSSIQTMIQLKEQNLVDEEDSQQFFSDLKRTTQRTQDLLDNLLKWAILNSNQFKPQIAEIDLKEVALEVVKTAEGQIKQKNIRIAINLENGLRIKGDRNMITTVIRNLLSNALKFTAVGGTVTLEGVQKEKLVLIRVIDTGIGISDEMLNSLFDLDHQELSEGTAGERGTGLGLVLAKEFVEKNNGQIRVESKVNEGSNFELSFPVA